MTEPIKTDFKTWERETLERFAREVADENARLREDNALLLRQWRAAVLESQTKQG